MFTHSKEDQLYLKTDTFWKSHFYIGDICYIDNITYTAEEKKFTLSKEDQLYHTKDTFWKSHFYSDTYIQSR